MKWSNAWKLKKGWAIYKWDDKWVELVNENMAPVTRIVLPPLVCRLMDEARTDERHKCREEIRRAISLE